MSRKVRRKIKRVCPECEEGMLELVEYSNVHDDVEYIETLIECPVCQYTEEGKTQRYKELEVDDNER